MKCPNCGSFLTGDIKVCPNCGTAVNITAPSAIQPEQVQTQVAQPIQPAQPVQPVPTPVAPVPVQQVQTQQVPAQPSLITPTSTKPKQSKAKKIILAIVLIIIIGIAVFGWYLFTPKVRFMAALDKSYTELFDVLDTKNNKILSLASDNVTEINSTIGFTTTGLGELFGIDDLNYGLVSKVFNDPTGKQLVYDVELLNNETSLIAIDGLLNKDKLYFMVKDVMTNYYYTDGKYNNVFDTQDFEDYEYLAEIVKNSINQSIGDSDFKSSKAELTLSDTKFNLTKLSLEVSEKLTQEIAINTLKNIKKDDKALDIIIKLYMTEGDLTKKELISKINDAIKEIEAEELDTSNNVYFNIYINGYNDIYRYEIYEDKDNYMTFDNYEIKGKEYKGFSNTEAGEIKVDITYKETEKDKYTVEGDFAGDFTVTGTVIYNEDKTELDLIFASEGEEIEFNLTNESEEVKNDKEYNGTTELNISYSDYNISFTMNNNYKFGSAVPEIDVSQAKDESEITEAELNTIQEKLTGSSPFASDTEYEEEVYY